VVVTRRLRQLDACGGAKIAVVHTEDIAPRLVAKLVAAQFPQWAELPVRRVSLDGWDNTTFRLGRELTARLPSHARYVAQVEKEQRWLPVLRRSLPFPIPEPVAAGRPTADFPRPWSIQRWIDGDSATAESVADSAAFAVDLAQFLRALHSVDAADGPAAGAHSFFRGGSLATYDVATRTAIAALADRLDAATASDVWESAVSTSWERPPVWVHGDIAPSNILVRHGRIHAVIDFGCCAVGDPACDLAIAWTFLDDESRALFRRALPLDDATWARGRAWALWKALITLLEDEPAGRGRHGAVTSRRFGWSGNARDVVDRVLADHVRTHRRRDVPIR
jgi:aminoglycoside phosphotransferase (APT) family kinase protein